MELDARKRKVRRRVSRIALTSGVYLSFAASGSRWAAFVGRFVCAKWSPLCVLAVLVRSVYFFRIGFLVVAPYPSIGTP